MSFSYPTEWPQFFTASTKSRQPLLGLEKYKRIITDSLKFMVINKRIELNAFVPIAIGMDDHLHLTCLPVGRYGNLYRDKRYPPSNLAS